MHDQHDNLLAGHFQMLDLVVHGTPLSVINGAADVAPFLGFGLAMAAGVGQLFSP
jgi:hypothetical protein